MAQTIDAGGYSKDGIDSKYKEHPNERQVQDKVSCEDPDYQTRLILNDIGDMIASIVYCLHKARNAFQGYEDNHP